MSLPTGGDYQNAIQNPKIVFSDDELKQGTIETNMLELPMVYSGNFTATFHIKTDDNNRAVRCFIRKIPQLETIYKAVEKRTSDNPYFVKARYLEDGIRVNDKVHPIIKMDWVNGDLLHLYIENNLKDKDKLKSLSEKFIKMINKLEDEDIAHCDLQHGNIIIKDDEFYLIDYDGLYLDELSFLNGESNSGHPNYQHPKRDLDDFHKDLDRFSAIVIYLSIVSCAEIPTLWDKYHNEENLIFAETDFAYPNKSELLRDLEKSENEEFVEMVKRFKKICNLKDLTKIPRLRDFISSNYEIEEEDLEIEEESEKSEPEMANWMSEWGYGEIKTENGNSNTTQNASMKYNALNNRTTTNRSPETGERVKSLIAMIFGIVSFSLTLFTTLIVILSFYNIVNEKIYSRYSSRYLERYFEDNPSYIFEIIKKSIITTEFAVYMTFWISIMMGISIAGLILIKDIDFNSIYYKRKRIGSVFSTLAITHNSIFFFVMLLFLIE